MKKLLLLALSIASPHIFSMEKEEPTFPWEQLLPELKNEVLKQVANAPTIAQAIRNLQKIRFVNKDLYNSITTNKTTVFYILDSLLKKFPGYEVAIARALNTQLAEEWLKTVNPRARFKIITMDIAQRSKLVELIQKNDLQGLKKLFDQGYNPRNRIIQDSYIDTFAAYENSIPTLQLISQYDSSVFSLENIKKLLTIAIEQKELGAVENRAKRQPLIDYLREQLELHLGNQEAERFINDLSEKMRNYRQELRNSFKM